MSTHSAWQIIVPVKRAEHAKTRLRPPAGVRRAALARAMALDTLAAVSGVVPPEQVVVVTSDPLVRHAAHTLGMPTHPDPGGGLNAAIRSGLRSRPRAHQAVLLADVPALRATELTSVLADCATHRISLVTDHTGTGTSLLATTGPQLHPCFGTGSARAHQLALDAVVLDTCAPSLRQDVDDAADLADALRLGVGRHTLAALGQVDS